MQSQHNDDQGRGRRIVKKVAIGAGLLGAGLVIGKALGHAEGYKNAVADFPKSVEVIKPVLVNRTSYGKPQTYVRRYRVHQEVPLAA